jgi:hypothetical protein
MLRTARRSDIEEISEALSVTHTMARAMILLVADTPDEISRWVSKYGDHLTPARRNGIFGRIKQLGKDSDDAEEDGRDAYAG